jgi:hypothetical protein
LCQFCKLHFIGNRFVLNIKSFFRLDFLPEGTNIILEKLSGKDQKKKKPEIEKKELDTRMIMPGEQVQTIFMKQSF